MPESARPAAINIPDQSVESFLDLEPVLTENIEAGWNTTTRPFNPSSHSSGPIPTWASACNAAPMASNGAA